MDENLSSAKIDDLEDKLITIDYSSGSAENNINVLNKFINYLVIRHSLLANTKSLEKRTVISDEIDSLSSEIDYIETQLLDQNNNQKLTIQRNIDSLSSEIEFTKKLLLAQNVDTKLQTSNQIKILTNQLPFFDKKISDLEQIITEDQENLQLLKSVPDLYMKRTATNPTLNQVIYSYKSKHTDLVKSKQDTTAQIYNLEKKLEIMDNTQSQSKKLFELSQKRKNMKEQLEFLGNNQLQSKELRELSEKKDKLEVKLEDLENLNYIQTQTIGEIKTNTRNSKNVLTMVAGIILGLFAGFIGVFINEFVKNYRESKT